MRRRLAGGAIMLAFVFKGSHARGPSDALTLGRFSLSRWPTRASSRARRGSGSRRAATAVVEKRVARDVLTFGELAEAYLENQGQTPGAQLGPGRAAVERGPAAQWAHAAALEVTAYDLLAMLNAKLREGAPLPLGAEQRLVPVAVNPVIRVKRLVKEPNALGLSIGPEATAVLPMCYPRRAMLAK